MEDGKQEESKEGKEDKGEDNKPGESKGENKGENKEGSPTPLEQAEAINKKKEELLDRQEKLMERQEKLEATRMVGGRAQGGTVEQKEESPKEYRARVEKEMASGKIDFTDGN